MNSIQSAPQHKRRRLVRELLALLVAVFCGSLASADEPYARGKNYDLQHSKVALSFDLDQRKVIGDVTHTVSILRPGIDKLSFDSVGLQIHTVTVNKAPAKFD